MLLPPKSPSVANPRLDPSGQAQAVGADERIVLFLIGPGDPVVDQVTDDPPEAQNRPEDFTTWS